MVGWNPPPPNTRLSGSYSRRIHNGFPGRVAQDRWGLMKRARSLEGEPKPALLAHDLAS